MANRDLPPLLLEVLSSVSTLRKERILHTTMDSSVYNGYRLNCIKKKKKVLGLIELFNKDSITCLTHKEIFKEELKKIDTAAEDFVEYIDETLTQLEVNSEDDRIPELQVMRKSIIDAVKLNKKQVVEKIESIISNATSSSMIPPPTDTATLPDGALTSLPNTSSAISSVAKLTLRHKNIAEDIEEFKGVVNGIETMDDMSDSQITYYMRRIDSWDQRLKDITKESRKFEEEALGKDEVKTLVDEINVKLSELKLVKSTKVSELVNEDKDRGLNSLCENKHKSSVVFPEPFKGVMGENVFKFKKEIVAAIKDTQVKKADQVRTLIKYLKGDAKSRVGDHQPSLEAALKVLEDFYGNPNLIWLRYRQDFEKEFSGNVNAKWGTLGSTKRIDAIARLIEFIRQAVQFAEDYPQLKEDILSAYTVKLLMKSMPLEEVRMVYLSIDEVNATHRDKIEKIQDILERLKNCGILAVNELVEENTINRSANTGNRDSRPNSGQGRNPLGLSSHSGSVCSVDIKHDCTKCRKCEPNWGLLGLSSYTN